MLGLSLIHAGFLAAGLAVVIPIVIHLLFRQRSRIESIGSLRFLRQIVKEHQRRRRVRQWLLLALRMPPARSASHIASRESVSSFS